MIKLQSFCAFVILCLLSSFLLIGAAELRAQSSDSLLISPDTLHVNAPHRALGGIEGGYAWRTDNFHGILFRLFYEAEIDRMFLNAGAFSYQKINDGFGFDFRLRFPGLFYPGGTRSDLAPDIGMSLTVWPVYKPTVSIGFPIGIEHEFMTDGFPNLSVSAHAAPIINLSAIPNTFIFDLRIGIRFD
ncbi:MAG: hypothetical protein ABI778_01115 [Ignavibacteriota bacterium]